MNKEELIKKVNENSSAAWLLFEIKNLEVTFGLDGDGPMNRDVFQFKNIAGRNHSMADTIENLLEVFMEMVYEETPEDEEWDKAYDLIQGLELDSIRGGHIFTEVKQSINI
jgi:hypothetical protein